MLDRRWWDAAVIAASLAVAVAVALAGAAAAEILIAAGALALFLGAYAFVARAGLRDQRRWRMPVFAALTAVALAAGCAVQPFFAITQAIAYPLVWVLAGRRRPAIVGSAVVALGVFVGFSLFAGILDGGSSVLPALATAAASAGFGLAFAIAFGLWISSVVEYGDERARLVAELTAAQSEVEALSRDRGASEERERMARDIHDTLAQTLAGLVILAERAGRQSRDGQTDAAAATVSTVEQVARDALTEARALVARTAAVPSEPAFGAAVERLVDRFRSHGSATISLELGDTSGPIERDAQVVLLRCLQEGLSNAVKHADARRIIVRVAVSADGAGTLEVIDDGRGFDDTAPRSGFGIDGMSDRVALAGGLLDLEATSGGGTTLRVVLPPARAHAEEAPS